MTILFPITVPAIDGSVFKGGFFTRQGGISKGIYAQLNTGLGSADNRENVLENRRRIACHFGMETTALLSCYQVHSNDVVIVTGFEENEMRPKADALVTNRPRIALGILTADCGPVLLVDRKNAVIGAAHAGWKGTLGGILENTIAAMERLGAERNSIDAILGPTISAENYEVGPEFINRLLDLDMTNQRFMTSSKNRHHAMFDLPAYIINRLANAGVRAEWTGQCTYADEDRFFSCRRATHRNEPDYGRQISALTMIG